jgi:nucleoid DNA-binding protein
MDKPISMSVKEYLSRLLSIKKDIPLKTIEAIVDHQFQSANKALRNNNYSIEISGFGKFLFLHSKAHKKYIKNLSKEKYFTRQINDPSVSEERRKQCERNLKQTLEWLENIKPKINNGEHITNIRRLEKQIDPSILYEGIDRKYVSGENGSMQELPILLREQEEANGLDNTKVG